MKILLDIVVIGILALSFMIPIFISVDRPTGKVANSLFKLSSIMLAVTGGIFIGYLIASAETGIQTPWRAIVFGLAVFFDLIIIITSGAYVAGRNNRR